RHDDLEDRRHPVGQCRFRHEGFRRVLVGAPDGDVPVALEPGDQLVESAQPPFRTDGDRLVAHDRRQSVHKKSILAPTSVRTSALGGWRMPTSGSILGNAVRRLEDPTLLTGEGNYVDDLVETNTLHVAFVRSPVAHANVR